MGNPDDGISVMQDFSPDNRRFGSGMLAGESNVRINVTQVARCRYTLVRAVAAAALLFAAATASRTSAAPPLIGLGFLPGGDSSEAHAVSGDGGVVVGRAEKNEGGVIVTLAFRWTRTGGMQELSGGGLHSRARGVSDTGAAIVGISDRAFRWTSALNSIVTLPFPAGGTQSDAYGVSGDGTVVVGYAGVPNGTNTINHAYRWTAAGSILDLGTLPGGTTSYAYGASGDGTVIVGQSATSGAGDYRAFRWTASGGMDNLGTMGGYSYAYAANSDGSVVVGHCGAFPFGDNSFYRAFRWTPAHGMLNLGTLPGGGDSWAYGVCGDGSAVVGYVSMPDEAHAFLWTTTLGIVDLNTYLPSLGIDLSGWTLKFANGISEDGLTIVGLGIHNGRYEAWAASISQACNRADVASLGGHRPPDGQLTADDLILFLSAYFAGQPLADLAGSGGVLGRDGTYTADDVIVFLAAFFAGCPQ